MVLLIGCKNNKKHLQDELDNFKYKTEEFERLLEIAISSEDFSHQNELETQILQFKNMVDSSLAIRQYLIESKYTQLQCVNGSDDIVVDQYIEQQIVKRMSEAREQIHENTEKELKKKFRNKLKKSKTKNKKSISAEFENYVGELEEELQNEKEKTIELSKEAELKYQKINELISQTKDDQREAFRLKSISEKYKIHILDLESKFKDVSAELVKLNKKNEEKDDIIETLLGQPNRNAESL